MKMIKFFALLLLMSSLTIQAAAQKGPRGKSKLDIDQLKTELNLSEDQITQITALKESHMAETQSLKTNEDLTNEERKSQFQEMRADHKTAFEAILTGEQLGKLENIKKERREKGKAMRAENKRNQQANRAELMKLRSEFDSNIDEEDRNRIEELRSVLGKEKMKQKEMRKGNKVKQKGNKEMRKGKRAMMADHEEELMELKSLSKKYGEEIKSFLDSKGFEPKMRGQRNDMKDKEARNKARQAPNQKGRHAARFLLLDFESSSALDENTGAEIKIFPNPSSDWSTVNYEVRVNGNVMVQLKDEQGNTIETYVNEFANKGDYNLEIKTSNLSNKNYFLVVTDQNGVTSKQLVKIK